MNLGHFILFRTYKNGEKNGGKWTMMIKQWKDSAEKKKFKRRRSAIQNIFMMKRDLFAKTNEEQAIQNSNPQEASEDINLDIKEEGKRYKGFRLIQVPQKKEKKLKEKVLNCKSHTNFKGKCPFIRCFWTPLGHTKANCHLKMIEYIYHRVKEDMARKQNKMEENQEKRKLKKEQKELEKKTLMLRGKELNSKLEQKMGKEKCKFLHGKEYQKLNKKDLDF